MNISSKFSNLKGNLVTLLAKSLEYLENTMEALAYDILIYCKWLGTHDK